MTRLLAAVGPTMWKTPILAIARMSSEEKVRISCWANQLHLIHGKPVGSILFSHCFLPPPLHYTIHLIIQNSTLHKTYWWVRIGSLYIQVDYPGIFDNWKITLGQKRSFLCYVYHTKPFPGLSTQGTLAKSKNNTGLCVATAFRELSPLLVNSASPFLVTIWWFDFCAPD